MNKVKTSGTTQRCAATAALVLGVPFALCVPGTARAATLQPVLDWGASGVPATVSMYIYVPDALAVNPPILVLSHFCGGTASAVFGQAQGGGVVAAADQYGFIMIVPQAENADGSGRCWDVGSTRALTRDGGGDPHAVAQMVDYTIGEYDANAERVYATGDSSGGMMTQALLALYPDVFKAGAAFAGVPAGCWAESNPDGSWSGPCAGGSVTHTGAEWGDLARAMAPGYTGRRPRVQLFHGDADDIISYTNHTEAIKQWTNLLELSETPTSTDTVQLGDHQATRQRWENSCGYVVLDAFASLEGDHGPSDALFEAEYVVPFLGLDQSGATDPEVEQCDAGNTSSTTGSGGATASTATATGDATSTASGDTTSTLGSSSSSSGSSNSTTATQSASATSSTTGEGGSQNTPTATATTSSASTGSALGLSSTGDASTSLANSATTAGSSGGEPEASADEGGCGCRTAPGGSNSIPPSAFSLFGLLALCRRVRCDASRARLATTRGR